MSQCTSPHERGMATESENALGSDTKSQDPHYMQNEVPRYVYEALGGFDKIRILNLHVTKERIECSPARGQRLRRRISSTLLRLG